MPSSYTHMPVIQSIIDFIESLGYVLVAVRAASCVDWRRPNSIGARDSMTFMSLAHARRNTQTCGEFTATRVDTLRIFQNSRPDRAQILALAHRARELGAPTKGSVIIEIQWDESRGLMDRDILRALIYARANTCAKCARISRKLRKQSQEFSTPRAPDMLIISHVESYDANPSATADKLQ